MTHANDPRDLSVDSLLAIDGKAQRGSTPHSEDEKKAQLVSALSVQSQRTLGTLLVEQKSNEIPAARELLEKIGALDGHLLMLDALHTNAETVRQIVQDCGADYLLPLKDNHEALRQRASECLPPPPPPPPPPASSPASPPVKIPNSPPARGLSPSGSAAAPVRYRRHGRTQSRPLRNSPRTGRLG